VRVGSQISFLLASFTHSFVSRKPRLDAFEAFVRFKALLFGLFRGNDSGITRMRLHRASFVQNSEAESRSFRTCEHGSGLEGFDLRFQPDLARSWTSDVCLHQHVECYLPCIILSWRWRNPNHRNLSTTQFSSSLRRDSSPVILSPFRPRKLNESSTCDRSIICMCWLKGRRERARAIHFASVIRP
jgi:hypothetical protein